ncbi:MAG TPA: hypothetical protein VL282_05235, partial [Tepidisphaeraceae bacterium]|nr:hypothetical protein [Tepidisphaeraceae bacterium]
NISDLHELLLTQSAEGSFALSDDVAKLLPRGASELQTWRATIESEAAAIGTIRPTPPEAIETVLVVLAIEICFADQAQVWSRSAQKAVRYLASATGANVYEIKTWLEHLTHKLGAVSA